MTASHAAALRRTAAVVRNRRNVANQNNVQPRGGERADRGFAAGTGPLYAHFDALHAVLVARDARGRQRGLLRGVRRALARTLEADGAGGRPAHGASVGIGDGDLRVVERRSHVHDTVRDNAALTLLLEFFLALCGRFSWRCAFRRSCRGFWFFCHDSLRFVLSQNLKSCQARRSSAAHLQPELQNHGSKDPPLQMLSPSCRRSSSWLRRRRGADPCGYARWCACAGREREDCGGDESRDTPEFQSSGGCSSESPCGDRLRRGLPARWPGGCD